MLAEGFTMDEIREKEAEEKRLEQAEIENEE